MQPIGSGGTFIVADDRVAPIIGLENGETNGSEHHRQGAG